MNNKSKDSKSELYIEQINLLYKTGYGALIGVLIVSIFLVIALWITTKNTDLFWWISILALIILGRWLSISHFLNADIQKKAYVFWAAVYVFGVFLSGLMWGIAGFIFFNPENLIVIVILITFTLGLAAGAATSISIYYPAFFCFIFSAIMPLAIRLFLEGGIFIPFGSAVVFYIAASTIFARQYQIAALESLKLRYENIELIERVTREKEKFEQEKKLAEEANIAKSKFLAATSHDLRQPLHALGLLISTLESTNEPILREEIIDQTKKSVHALDDLFNSLLDISKLDAGIVDINIEIFCLDDLFNRLRNDFSPVAKEKNLTLNILNSNKYVKSDPVLIDRILRNLISNAVCYTQTGKILVGARSSGENISIGVWDQGIGIPEDDIENVFSEFSQLHNPERDRSKGIGLGLAIVKRLCNLLGHSYKLQSTHTKGTYFRFIVPKGSKINLTDAEHPVTKVDNLQSKVILVIDDERAILDSMKLLLTKWGCFVLISDSFSDAIEQINNFNRNIDVIIADYRLRGSETGIMAIHNIEKSLDYNVNSILISGDTSPDILKEVKTSGLPLLHKPVKPAQLKLAISSISC